MVARTGSSPLLTCPSLHRTMLDMTKRKPRSYKKYITYIEIAEAAQVKLGTARKDAVGDYKRTPKYDPNDLESLISYVCKRRGWTLIK